MVYGVLTADGVLCVPIVYSIDRSIGWPLAGLASQPAVTAKVIATDESGPRSPGVVPRSHVRVWPLIVGSAVETVEPLLGD